MTNPNYPYDYWREGADKIRVRRGDRKDLPLLDLGEPGLSTDTKRFYIGLGAENMEMATVDDLVPLARKVYRLPQEFNAVADGATDDAPSFRNAVATGTKFFIAPRGTYRMNSDFILTKENVHIMGETRGSTVLQNGIGKVVYSATIDMKNNDGSLISNLTIDGNFDVVPGNINQGVACMRIEKSKNVTVRDVNFRNNKFVGCMIADVQNITFDNCDFTNIDSGINGQEGTGLTDGVRIINCSFDGHSASEPVSIPLAKNITIAHCKMLNKSAGHAIALDGSKHVFINDVYTYNCANGLYFTERKGVRNQHIHVKDCYFDKNVFGNRLEYTDSILFENCVFIDGITTLKDCKNVEFRNCHFISDTRACMVTFGDAPSENIRFVKCTFDNSKDFMWVGTVLEIYGDTVVKDILFEDCTLINCDIFHKKLPNGSNMILRNNLTESGSVYTWVENNVKIDNLKTLRIIGDEAPWKGYIPKGETFLYANPTTHIGGINMQEGWAYWDTWAGPTYTVAEDVHLLLSNGIVVRAKTAGESLTEPIAIAPTHTDTSPLVLDGIQWVYLGAPCVFKDFGAIEA